MNRSSAQPVCALEAQEARLGLRLAATLNERVIEMPHDISERLRVGREQAVAVGRQALAARAAARPAMLVSGRNGTAALAGLPELWLRLASWLPLAVLVLGLALIQQWSDREQVLAAAEIDTVLLADDLPPDAYVDAGFREFLRAPRP